LEYVPAFTTTLLKFDSVRATGFDPKAFAVRLEKVMEEKQVMPVPKEIPVVYDGPDLSRVAEANGLTAVEVCRLHSRPVYKVYMIGFAPGFPYLGELDPRLHTPRLSSPRLSVPAGSVAIGGAHTGVYPVDGPGGWNVIGHTALKLFDATRVEGVERVEAAEEAFLVRAGDRIRFVPSEPGEGGE
jgi:inhibitor of KinA